MRRRRSRISGIDHLDIEAATAGTIANAKNWKLEDNKIQTADGSRGEVYRSMTTDPRDVPYGDR